MPTPWEARVQKTGQLTVFPAPAMLRASAWGPNLFQRILSEFNRLAQANTLGVRVVPSDQEPQRNGLGADVRFDATVGPCSFFNAAGKDETANLDTSPGHVRGACCMVRALSGSPITHLFCWKAFIFMPENPRTSPTRTVGVHVRIAVALHELFHACGLHEDDPGHGQPDSPAPGELDLFATGGVVLESSNPDSDQMLIGGKVIPGKNGFRITTQTARLVQSVWLEGRF